MPAFGGVPQLKYPLAACRAVHSRARAAVPDLGLPGLSAERLQHQGLAAYKPLAWCAGRSDKSIDQSPGMKAGPP